MSKKEKKTIKIDKRLLVIISLSFLVLLGIGGYFLYEYLELKKPIDEKWGDTYYVYLKDIKNNKKKAGLPNKLNKAKVGFYKVKDVKDPIMVIEYEKDKETYSNIYYIENDKVNNIVYNEPTEIEFLYNIEEKEYNYYAHTKDKESDTYSNVSNKINKEDEKNYTFEKNEKDSVIDVNGKEISISKYDETFIEPKVKDNKESWDTFLKEQVLKDILKRLIKKCTPQEKIEKQVKKEVDKQVGDITKKQEEMKNAQAEVEKKKQEDEEKRKAEEEARGLKVGNFTIKYGTYEATFGSEYNESYQGHDIITINPDGTFTRTLDGSHSDGRYYIYNEKCIGIGQDGICIGSVDSDGFFSDGSGIHYKYQK